MTIAKPLQLTEDPSSEEIILPPGDLESDEPELESDLHLQQIIILLQCLEWLWQGRDDFYAAGNMTIYYNAQKITTRDFRGPDFFVALDTSKRSRKSWMLWEEGGKYPNVIIEILSPATAKLDRTEKKLLYQDVFRVLEYFWFHPVTLEFEGFTLVGGQYQPIQSNSQGRLWSDQLKLYLGIHQRQLRYFTPEGELVPTPEEAARQAQENLEQTQQQLEQLKAQLKALGIEPNLE
jgi:Uma2 family endonuclease